MTCLTRSASTKLYLHVNKSSQAGIGNPRGLSVRGREGKCYKQSACTAGAARMLRAAPRSQRGVKNCISYTVARCKIHNSFSHATRNAYPTRARSHTEGDMYMHMLKSCPDLPVPPPRPEPSAGPPFDGRNAYRPFGTGCGEGWAPPHTAPYQFRQRGAVTKLVDRSTRIWQASG